MAQLKKAWWGVEVFQEGMADSSLATKNTGRFVARWDSPPDNVTKKSEFSELSDVLSRARSTSLNQHASIFPSNSENPCS